MSKITINGNEITLNGEKFLLDKLRKAAEGYSLDEGAYGIDDIKRYLALSSGVTIGGFSRNALQSIVEDKQTTSKNRIQSISRAQSPRRIQSLPQEIREEKYGWRTKSEYLAYQAEVNEQTKDEVLLTTFKPEFLIIGTLSNIYDAYEYSRENRVPFLDLDNDYKILLDKFNVFMVPHEFNIKKTYSVNI